MLQLVQAGTGPRRHIILGYFCDTLHVETDLPEILGEDVCLLQDLDDAHGRFAAAPGHGGVDPIEDVVAFAHEHCGEFEVGKIVLMGWSAGCQAVREQLRSDDHEIISGAVALDGISGSVPPLPAQMAPWYAMVDRAKLGSGSLLIVTHTAMQYMENLPAGQRYESTTHTAAMLCERAGLTPPGPGGEASLGDFTVVSSPSANIDGPAHIHQVKVVLPDVAKRFLVPWLAAEAPPSTQPQGA